MADTQSKAITFEEILNNKASWAMIKAYGTLIGKKYGRRWDIQTQYMLNAYIGECNNLEMINNPAIQEVVNNAIIEKRANDITLPELYLGKHYKFNPYPNDHKTFEDIDEIDPTQNVTDIIYDGQLPDDQTIFDIDSKNTAEFGIGTDKPHRADMIFYNNQDSGEVTVYLAKFTKRSARTDMNDYIEICKLPGPINYKRISFISGYPKIIDFADKSSRDEHIILPRKSDEALNYLKEIAKKNSNYVSQHLDKYGARGQELVSNYNNFYDNAIDVFSAIYQVVDRNIKNKAMYNLIVVFANTKGELQQIVFKNLNNYDIDKVKNF